MASLTRWTWVWVNSGSWWWTGRPGVLQFMGSQRVGHDWATEMNWIKEIKPVNPKGNQPWIFIGRTDAKAQAPGLWANQCEQPTYWKRPWWWERLKSKVEEDVRGRWLYIITDLMDINLNKLWEIVEDREAWHAVVHGVPKNWTWLSDWATTTISFSYTA